MIDWNKYQQEALTTAIYPLERELDYTVLGLLSEVGELAEVFWDCYDQVDKWARMKGEGGDCFWYTAAVADAIKVPLQDVWDRREVIVTYHFNDHILTKLTVVTGRIAGIVKKSIRDDGGVISVERREQIIGLLGEVLQLLVNLANQTGSSAAGYTQANLNKLSDRKSRGVLTGSGDHR